MTDIDDWYEHDDDDYDWEPNCGTCMDSRVGCRSCNPTRWQAFVDRWRWHLAWHLRRLRDRLAGRSTYTPRDGSPF